MFYLTNPNPIDSRDVPITGPCMLWIKCLMLPITCFFLTPITTPIGTTNHNTTYSVITLIPVLYYCYSRYMYSLVTAASLQLCQSLDRCTTHQIARSIRLVGSGIISLPIGINVYEILCWHILKRVIWLAFWWPESACIWSPASTWITSNHRGITMSKIPFTFNEDYKNKFG